MWFTRFAGKENIKDSELKEIVNQLEMGYANADLGGGVYKMRMARSGKGKSGGYRVIMFFRSKEKTFYHYAYPKAARENISEKELQFFKKLSKKYLALTDDQLATALDAGELIEI